MPSESTITTSSSPDDSASLDPLDVALSAPFSSNETPSSTTTSLPTPQSSYLYHSDDQNVEWSSPYDQLDTAWDDLGPSPPTDIGTQPHPLPPTVPLLRDMDSFGEGSARGSFDFTLRSASSTEHLSQSFSSLLSISARSHRRPSDSSDIASVNGAGGPTSAVVVMATSGLSSITETNLEGGIDSSPISPSIDLPEIPVFPSAVPSDCASDVNGTSRPKRSGKSVAFSLEEPARSIEVWRDDVLTSTQVDSEMGFVANVNRNIPDFEEYVFGGSIPASSAISNTMRPARPRVLKRHISLISVETDYQKQKHAKRWREYLSRVQTIPSAGQGSASASPRGERLALF